MAIDRATIERIDSTLLPQLDRHHLRVLSHCLDSFQSMAAPGSTCLLYTSPSPRD